MQVGLSYFASCNNLIIRELEISNRTQINLGKISAIPFKTTTKQNI